MLDLLLITAGLLGAAVLANEVRNATEAQRPKKRPVPIKIDHEN
jgi:hypothetical protein